MELRSWLVSLVTLSAAGAANNPVAGTDPIMPASELPRIYTPTPIPPVPPVVFKSSGPVPGSVSTQAAQRGVFGLDNSVAVVEQLLAAPDSNLSLGFVLSPAEFEMVEEQLRIEGGMQAADAVLAKNSEGYAGMTIDHARQGLITVYVVNDLISSSQIAEALPDGTTFESVPADHPLKQLQSISDSIAIALEAQGWTVGQAKVLALSVDIYHNVVDVVIDPNDAAGADDILARFGFLPIRVRLEHRDPLKLASNTDTPGMGGQRTLNWGYSGADLTSACSDAFPARTASGAKGMLTAGHCGSLNQYFTTAAPTIGAIGPISRRSWYQENPYRDTDAAYMSQSGGNNSGVYTPGTGAKNITTLRYGWTNGIAPGRSVDMTAAFTDNRYWQLQGVYEFDVSIDTVVGWLHHFQTSFLCAQEGDSGSPVYTFESDGTLAAGGIMAYTTSPLPDCYPDYVAWGRINLALERMSYPDALYLRTA